MTTSSDVMRQALLLIVDSAEGPALPDARRKELVASIAACASRDEAEAWLSGVTFAAELLLREAGPCPAALDLVATVIAFAARIPNGAELSARAESVRAKARVVVGAGRVMAPLDSGARPAGTTAAGPSARFTLQADGEPAPLIAASPSCRAVPRRSASPSCHPVPSRSGSPSCHAVPSRSASPSCHDVDHRGE